MEQSPIKSPQKKLMRISSSDRFPIESEHEIGALEAQQTEKSNVLAHCHLSKACIQNFVQNSNIPLTESLFYAVLCLIAITTNRNIVVLPVEYMRNLREKEEGIFAMEMTVTAKEICFGSSENSDMIIIPTYKMGYYSIAFCEKANRIVTIRYFDTLGNPLDDMTRKILRSVASQMQNENSNIRVYQAKEYSYNTADSAEQTMLICCSITRLFLQDKNHTFIEDFSLENERNLIAKYLNASISNEDFPTMEQEIASNAVMRMHDSIWNFCNHYDPRVWKKLKKYLKNFTLGFPHHELKLKKHSTVMLMRNINIRRGLSNGTRMEVIAMHNHSIECKLIDGDRAGEIEFIPRITLHCADQYPFTLKRHQFPLRLAFSFTIIKSQGQTMSKVGIDLRTDVFSHGQLYVALSRARSFEGIKVKLRENETETKNIVYKNLIEI